MSHENNETLAAEITRLRQRIAELEAGTTIEKPAYTDADKACRLLFEANPYPLLVCHTETLQFLAVNTAAIMQYGYTADEFLSMTIAHIQATNVSPQFQERILAQDWCTVGMQRHSRKNGEMIDVLIEASLLLFAGQPAVMMMARDVTRQGYIEESWHKTDLEIRLLSEAAGLLSRTLDPHAVYDTMYRFVSQIMDCADLFVSSYNADDRLIHCTYARHEGQPLDVSLFPPIPLEPEGFGMQSMVIRTGQSLIISDLEARLKQTQTKYYVDANKVVEGDFPDDGTDHTRSALIVPIKVDSRVIGVIQVASYHYDAYTADHQRMLEALMIQVGVASVNAALYQQAQNELVERRQAEQALRESEARYRCLFEHSPISLWEEDFSAVKAYLDDLRTAGVSDFRQYFADHRETVVHCASLIKILDVNQATLKFFKVRYPEKFSGGLDKLIAAESMNVFGEELLALLDGKTWFEGEVMGMTSDGDPIVSFITLSVVEGYKESWSKVFVAVNNITERKRTERVLQQSRQQYKALVDSIDGVVWEFALPSLSFTFVSSRAERMFGYPVERWLTEPDFWANHMHPDDRTWAVDYCLGSARNKQHHDFEYRMITLDGQIVWVRDIVSVVVEEDQPVMMRGVMIDITANKQAEEAARASEEQTQMILRTAMDGFWMVDMQGHILTANETYCRMTGYSLDELRQMSIQNISMIEDQEDVIRHIQKIRQSSSDRFETRHRCKDGQSIDLEASVRFMPQINCLAIFMHDVTERKRTEEALRESEARLRMLTSQVPALLWTVDRNLRFTSTSGSDRTLLGSAPDQANGLSLHEYYRTDDDTYFPIVAHRRALAGESVAYEQVWVDRAYQTLLEPLRDSEGSIIGVIGIATDITEHKRAEAALREWDRLQMALEKEKQLNTIKSNVMRTISHEFRTPLAIIATSGSLLDRYFDRMTPDQRKERLHTIQHQVHRLSQMIEDISAVVHEVFNKFVFEPGEVNLEALCQSNITELQSTIGAKHRIIYTGDERLQNVFVDERLVNRILINLLSNAIKYSPEGSEIGVKLHKVGDEAVIQVSDHGIGIAAEDQKRLFEPFFRAQNARLVSGSGLGLSIVHDCVMLHRGTITVESELNQGATFTVRLPAERRLLE